VTEQDHKLGEVLRAAREAKEIDLIRVERDTKIRERYLSALERGEYRELPGAVYTKGFLRNYGAYLGLDPEYLIDLYRLETSASAADRPIVAGPPRPITVRRRRTFVVTPGAVAAAILTILVGAFIAWLGFEFVNFARTPELRIIEPAGDVSAHTQQTITLRGITAPDATITVSGLPENPSTTADADGNFEITVGLLPGSNEIRVQAMDPVTDRDSAVSVLRVNVVSAADPSPSIGAVTLTLDQPAADATLTGAVPVSGTAAPAEQIQLSAVLVTAPAPTFSVTDPAGAAVKLNPVAPVAPQPASVTADATGGFSGSLSLGPGTWDVVVTPTSTEPVTRRVTVRPADGLAATLLLEGGDSYLELEQDGVPLAGVSGGISNDGERVNLSAKTTIRIRAGNAGAVRLSLNGIGLGPMGANGAVIEWRIARSGD
jgi:cytoskeletal protein RodZ